MAPGWFMVLDGSGLSQARSELSRRDGIVWSRLPGASARVETLNRKPRRGSFGSSFPRSQTSRASSWPELEMSLGSSGWGAPDKGM